MGSVGRNAPKGRGSEEIYLDANATVRPLDCVVEVVTAAMREAWGNPQANMAPESVPAGCSREHEMQQRRCFRESTQNTWC